MSFQKGQEFPYEFEYWVPRFKSQPRLVIASLDLSESYEMEAFHVFKLFNGQFAAVNESGRSCYSPNEAYIELHPDKDSAMTAFNKWERETRKERGL